MPALKSNTLLPSPEENAQITSAAFADSDTVPLTDANGNE